MKMAATAEEKVMAAMLSAAGFRNLLEYFELETHCFTSKELSKDFLKVF